jgi:hypothetical protein
MSLEIQGHGVKGAIQVVQGFRSRQERPEMSWIKQTTSSKDVQGSRAAYPSGAKDIKVISRAPKDRSRATRLSIRNSKAVSYFFLLFSSAFMMEVHFDSKALDSPSSLLEILPKSSEGRRNHAGIVWSTVHIFSATIFVLVIYDCVEFWGLSILPSAFIVVRWRLFSDVEIPFKYRICLAERNSTLNFFPATMI